MLQVAALAEQPLAESHPLGHLRVLQLAVPLQATSQAQLLLQSTLAHWLIPPPDPQVTWHGPAPHCTGPAQEDVARHLRLQDFPS